MSARNYVKFLVGKSLCLIKLDLVFFLGECYSYVGAYYNINKIFERTFRYEIELVVPSGYKGIY